MKKPSLAPLSAAIMCFAHTTYASPSQDETSFSLGSVNVNDDNVDRVLGGVRLDRHQLNGNEYHFELMVLDSATETSVYGAVGLSTLIYPGLQGTAALGFSDSDDGFLPVLSIDGAIEKDFGADTGWLARGGVSYTQYANNDVTVLRAEAVHYSPDDAHGGYFVQQFGGSVTDTLGSNTQGWEAGAGITYAFASGISTGVSLAAGRIAYDTRTGDAIENDFTAVRPKLAYNISETYEVYIQGEHVETETYDLNAVTLGLVIRSN